jgi:Uri superfamily endonuclease
MIKVQDLPVAPGAYALHLSLARSQIIRVGRLGRHHIPAGHYLYCGSAHGAGGLQARIGRHLRGEGVVHWHIDTLRAVAGVQGIFYTVTDRALECEWSQALARLAHAFIPVPRFGATDCRSGCRAHLIAFPRRADVAGVPQVLASMTPTPIVSLRPL